MSSHTNSKKYNKCALEITSYAMHYHYHNQYHNQYHHHSLFFFSMSHPISQRNLIVYKNCVFTPASMLGIGIIVGSTDAGIKYNTI